MNLAIMKVDNGYTVGWWEDDTLHEMVFEESVTEHGEIECFQRLLYYITEHYGMVGTKHEARRIRITTGGEDD